MHRVSKIKIKAGFSLETMQVRKYYSNISKVFKEKYQYRTLILSENVIQKEVEIKTSVAYKSQDNI